MAETCEVESSTPASDVVILDCGTDTTKIGYAGENYPRASIPTVLGKFKAGAVPMGFSSDSYVGQEAKQRQGLLNLSTPITRGIITNWDDMEVFFDHIFEEVLQINPSLYNIIITENLNNPDMNREKLIELMLEKYNFKSFYLSRAPPLILYAHGYVTGVVLDSGEGQTHVAPVYEGQSLPHSSRYIPLGGKDINRVLEYLLSIAGKGAEFFQTRGAKDFIRSVKEKMCYVAHDYEYEYAMAEKKSQLFRLPDGTHIEINNELFRCTETLFEPLMVGVKTGGIHENIYRSIQLSDQYLRPYLYDHIVLSSGNTLFPGLRERLYKEMKMIAEPNAKVRVHAREGRENAVFLGASLLGSLRIKELMITYSEYFENGPSIVHRRCF